LKPHTMSKKISLLLSLFIVFAALNAQKQADPSDLNAVFKPLKWRNIGPFRGGRSVCAPGVPGDMTTYYMGTTGGGLW
jgi:hypothetical protein